MSIINSDYYLNGLDLSYSCRPWRDTLSASGSYARVGNRAQPVAAIGAATNRALGRMPRVWFSKAWPVTDAPHTLESDPFIRWQAYDCVANARNFTVDILSLPRTSGSGNCYGYREGGALAEQTSINNATIGTLNDWEDLVHHRFTVARGAAANDVITEGLATYGGFTPMAITVQDEQLFGLDTDLHTYADAGGAKRGEKVQADILEDCRSAFEEVRRYNLPYVTQWAGHADLGVWQEPASTSAKAIVVTSSSWVNVIDQAETGRATYTPGISCHVQYMGWGPEDETAGQRVKCEGYIFASVTGGSAAGSVKFEGPVDSYTFTVPNGAAAWCGPGTFNLNSSYSDTDTSLGRNKVDILAQIPGRTAETMYIYALPSWQIAPP